MSEKILAVRKENKLTEKAPIRIPLSMIRKGFLALARLMGSKEK